MSIHLGQNSRVLYLASLLYDSIEDNNLSAVKQLLEKGANPNVILPRRGISSFHLAVGSNSDFAFRVTQLILKYGGNPNIQSDDGLTPVHIAAAWGRKDILQILLNSGGDPEMRDANYMTPIQYANKENSSDCVQILKYYTSTKNPSSKQNCDKVDLNAAFLGDETCVSDSNDKYKHFSIHKEQKKTLNDLPKTNATEYVMNWVDKHIEVPAQVKIEPIISFDSSLDESENETLNKMLQLGNPVFRKNYRKTRRVQGLGKSKVKFEKEPLRNNVTLNQNILYNKNNQIQSLSVNKISKDPISSESGIIMASNVTSKAPIIPDIQTSHCDTAKKAEISSDYMTASNGVSGNIFELTEDLTFDLLTLDETKHSTKIQEPVADLDISCVLSEICKYEDKDKGVVLYEQRLLKTPTECSGSIESGVSSSKLSSVPNSFVYDTDTLRKELTVRGCQPGPITVTTKRVYLKKLYHLTKNSLVQNKIAEVTQRKMYSNELEKSLRSPTWVSDILAYKFLDEAVVTEFSNPDPSKKWREGVSKSSFTYLLLDPRVTKNLPYRCDNMDKKEVWEKFLFAIFYVGKGKKSRPYSHLYDAISLWNQGKFDSANKKLKYILDIWKNGDGVVCLHIYHNIIPAEAYTREAAMIRALSIENLTNIKLGDFYGITTKWSQKNKKNYGVYLLYKAMIIFLNDGERQIYPCDIGKI